MTTASRPRVAIVTGAGRRRGIGRAIAVRLAQDGFAVVVHERTADPGSLLQHEIDDGWHGARSVVAEIEAAAGRAIAIDGDVTEAATARRLAEAAADLGDPAVLVNNAGTPGEASTFLAHETPEEIWDATMRINVGSIHRLSAVLVPVLASSPAVNRSIIHLSSTAGHRALPRYGAYCASKAAVERLTEQQAVELARWGIRVNCVAPGSTDTDMIDGTLGRAADHASIDAADIRSAVIKRIPLRRFAAPAEIAGAVAFLAGPDATFVTGQTLTVDGGMTLV